MGTWGPGIFADDTTCDVRGWYRRALRAGVPGPQATDQIIRDHIGAPDLADIFDTNGRVWLGLAATQVELGRLEDRVKAKALEVIDSGADLRAWRETTKRDQHLRRAALRRLRRRLLGPQRPPVHLPPPWRQDTSLEPGQHLLFRFPNGQRVLLRILDVQDFSLERTEGTAPVVMLLDWREDQKVPAGPALDHVPNALRWGALWFLVVRKGPRDGVPGRIQALPGRWPEAPWTGVGAGCWHTWDELQSRVPWMTSDTDAQDDVPS
jgi:hypothetical protein